MTNRKVPYDQVLILIVLSLLGFGLIMVFSASSVISEDMFGSSTRIFYRQFACVLAGVGLLVAAMKIDYHIYQKPGLVYAACAVALLLLAAALFGPEVNGVNRWVQLGPFRCQPSELSKLVVILLTAYILVRKGGRIQGLDRELIGYLTGVGLILALILLEPDFGTSTSIAVVVGLLLFLAGLRYRYYLACLLLFLPAFYFLVYRVPYRWQRIMAFLEPEADPYGAGYQALQSLIAVGSGGIGGKGLAQSTQKLFFLPEPHTDFIFAVIGEELGLVGCCVLVILFAVFLWRGIRVSLRADTVFGTYVGLGIVLTVVFQAFFNMSVVLSLCPTKGIPLPLISVGGSSLLVTLFAIGILLNISKHSRGCSLTREHIQ